jgi:hypothetical protein
MVSHRSASAVLVASLWLLFPILVSGSRSSGAPVQPTGERSRIVQLAQAGGVKGQDVMSGRNQGGPDGFAQAPIPRTDAPSGAAPGENKSDRSTDSLTRPVPDGGQKLSPGEDPGTPMAPMATAKPKL